MSVIYSPEHACLKAAELFVQQMPFNQLLGMELRACEGERAEVYLPNHARLIGNTAAGILHGGSIASVLDVTAGLVCVNSVILRYPSLSESELLPILEKVGTIDLHVNYLRPGRGDSFVATALLLRGGKKIAVARVELHNERQHHIATAVATYLVG